MIYEHYLGGVLVHYGVKGMKWGVRRTPVGKTKEKFSIPMSLGVTANRLFRTVWQKDGPDEAARFVTAYIDRRLEED